MPEGLNRTDLNTSGIDYLHGFPITLPHNFGNVVNWMVSPAHFGNLVTWSTPDPTHFGNPVNWVPNPAHFGNVNPPVGPTPPPSGNFLVQEDGTSLFELEDGSGFILLEN